MSLSIGIFGLPNVGKSTLFKALTKNPVDISNYPFCTIEPNIGIVEVPDPRLEKLAEITKPKKVVPAIIKFVDVAGLVKGAHKGEGLGNQFLAHLRETDTLLQIVRCFKAESVAHVDGEINPKRDIETIKSELILKDLETIEKRLQKIERAVPRSELRSTTGDVKAGKKETEMEFEVLNSLKEKLKQNEMARPFLENLEPEKKKIVENLFLLTAKPQIYLLNSNQNEIPEDLKKELGKEGSDWIQLNLRDELDKSELSEQERKEFGLGESKLDNLIKKCYEILNLITFFTIVGIEETRAWPIKAGVKIIEGARMVHSDFAEKFITAQVINWQKLSQIGSWKKCGELGLLKTVGKNYILKNGDVVAIKI